MDPTFHSTAPFVNAPPPVADTKVVPAGTVALRRPLVLAGRVCDVELPTMTAYESPQLVVSVAPALGDWVALLDGYVDAGGVPFVSQRCVTVRLGAQVSPIPVLTATLADFETS